SRGFQLITGAAGVSWSILIDQLYGCVLNSHRTNRLAGLLLRALFEHVLEVPDPIAAMGDQDPWIQNVDVRTYRRVQVEQDIPDIHIQLGPRGSRHETVNQHFPLCNSHVVNASHGSAEQGGARPYVDPANTDFVSQRLGQSS